MPRKDGFPTNAEMLEDLNETGRLLFVETFANLAANGLPPEYLGKPLHLLSLHAMTLYSAGSGIQLESEGLSVDPLHPENIAVLEFGEQPPAADILEFRRQQAAEMAAIVISPDMAIRDIMHPGQAVVNYRADYINGNTKSVGTFMPRPTKMVIASALHYAAARLEEQRRTAEAPDQDPLLAMMLKINREAAYKDRVLPYDSFVQLEFQLAPELPLNGLEPTDFLRRYHNYMREGVIRYEDRRNRLGARAGGAFVESIEAARTRYAEAKARAKALLEERGIEP